MLHGQQVEPSTQQQIYALRYEAYVDKQSIEQNDARVFTDPYDMTPNCHSFIEYVDETPAGSIRACVYTPDKPDLRIPAQELFPHEMAEQIGFGKKVVESNKFVVHPAFQNRLLRLKFTLFRHVFDTASEIDADYIVTLPRATQVDFYRNMQFEVISGVKKSLALDFDVVLMACNLQVARKLVADDPKFRTLKRFGFV